MKIQRRYIHGFFVEFKGPALYIIIFIAKTIEVSIATIRLVYVNKENA